MRTAGKWSSLLLLAAGCTSSHDVPAPDGLDIGLVQDERVSAKCQHEIDASQDGLPTDLECAGLFSNVANRTFYSDVREFLPAHILWSDSADKVRWIRLPKKTQIDSTDPGEWQFPIGTRFFKEFAYDATGAVETRVFLKVRSDYWVHTTHVWDAEHKGAVRDDGGSDVDVGIGMHHIPSGRECETCHDGRKDNILGFDAVSLGQAGAQGVTLASLVDDKLLTVPPPSTDLSIGDDGTGKGAEVIGWLHINCGVSCHNSDENSKAYSTGLRMKLDPTTLDGRPASEFSAEKSTVGVKAKTLQWSDQTRIVPGDPSNSLLYKLISSRGGGKNSQMPPLGSLRVDTEHVALIAAWIKSLPVPAADQITN
jgi:hypothetical protein